jgi:glucan phosphoethanolaminetransferase (alkaline phosphatase superfamily)
MIRKKGLVSSVVCIAIVVALAVSANIFIVRIASLASNAVSTGSIGSGLVTNGIALGAILLVGVIALLIIFIHFINVAIKARYWYIRVIAIVGILSILGVPTYGIKDGLDQAKGNVQSALNTYAEKQLENMYGSNYKEVINDKVTEKLDTMTPAEISDLEKKTGISVSDGMKLLNDGDYVKSLDLLKESSTIDVNAELQKAGIDPNNPLLNSILK